MNPFGLTQTLQLFKAFKEMLEITVTKKHLNTVLKHLLKAVACSVENVSQKTPEPCPDLTLQTVFMHRGLQLFLLWRKGCLFQRSHNVSLSPRGLEVPRHITASDKHSEEQIGKTKIWSCKVLSITADYTSLNSGLSVFFFTVVLCFDFLFSSGFRYLEDRRGRREKRFKTLKLSLRIISVVQGENTVQLLHI